MTNGSGARDDRMPAPERPFRLRMSGPEQPKGPLRDHLHAAVFHIWERRSRPRRVQSAEAAEALAPGGVLDAFIEATEQGLERFLGVTGHGTITPSIHRRSLERYDFDAVLLPYSYVMMQNPQYAADFEALVNLCQARDVAVQTIKSICRRPWDGKTQSYSTWYEPLEDPSEIDKAVDWVLSRPDFFLNTAGDIHLLPKVLDAATRFQSAPPPEVMAAQVTELEMAPLFV